VKQKLLLILRATAIRHECNSQGVLITIHLASIIYLL
jgi:hypothetical protein